MDVNGEMDGVDGRMDGGVDEDTGLGKWTKIPMVDAWAD